MKSKIFLENLKNILNLSLNQKVFNMGNGGKQFLKKVRFSNTLCFLWTKSTYYRNTKRWTEALQQIIKVKLLWELRKLAST